MLSKKSPCQTWKENSVEMKIAQLVVELYAVFCARAGTVAKLHYQILTYGAGFLLEVVQNAAGRFLKCWMLGSTPP